VGSSEQALAELRLRELLDAVGSRTPAPGGGTSAAVVGALAAGLVEMSAKFTPGREGVAAQAASLREQLLEQAEADLHAYQPVLDALRLDASDLDRDARLRDALSDAADSPLAIARAAAWVADLGEELSHTGNAHLKGDAITAVVLAEAACSAGVRLAEINLARVPSDPRLDEAAALTSRAAAARGQALGSTDGT
jgi:formiminotetrahydrofolate cyclodeaminase